MESLFSIFRVNSAEAARIAAAPDEPHQHDHEELIIGMEGRLQHFIDFNTIVLDAPLVSFVTRQKVHRVIPEPVQGRCELWVLRFKSEFIPELTFQLYANYHNHAMLKLPEGRCFSRLTTMCTLMHEEMAQPEPDLGVVRHLLTALFFMIESERTGVMADAGTNVPSQNSTLTSFLRLLEEHYQRPVGVDFYAERLFMSPRNLNLICKNILQQTVSEIIETRKLIEAKNQLTHSDRNISDIGFGLGYSEKAYFTTVFKRRTGQTPSEFREEMRRLLS